LNAEKDLKKKNLQTIKGEGKVDETLWIVEGIKPEYAWGKNPKALGQKERKKANASRKKFTSIRWSGQTTSLYWFKTGWKGGVSWKGKNRENGHRLARQDIILRGAEGRILNEFNYNGRKGGGPRRSCQSRDESRESHRIRQNEIGNCSSYEKERAISKEQSTRGKGGSKREAQRLTWWGKL